MKKIMRIVLALLIVLLASSLPASADRGRGMSGGTITRGGHIERGGHFEHGGRFEHGGSHLGVGVVIGPEWWWPGWWAPYPYYPYYSQPPIIVEQPADMYVQPAPDAEVTGYWYFCPDPQGYYPYVKKCPKGWLKVVPSGNPPDGEE